MPAHIVSYSTRQGLKIIIARLTNCRQSLRVGGTIWYNFHRLSLHGPDLHTCPAIMQIYFLTYCLLTPQEEETLRARILKRFTRFVGSLSAELICLPLKCFKLLSRIITGGLGVRDVICRFHRVNRVGFFYGPLRFGSANSNWPLISLLPH